MRARQMNKYGVITIFFACLFMIIQRILISNTVIPEYTQNPTRFYVYNIFLAITAIGGNLLALYLGYHSNETSGKKALKSLSGFYLIYIFVVLLINILGQSINIRDYWIIFFPISQNLFGYAVSFILIFLLSTTIISYLEKFSDYSFKSFFTVLSILFIVLPTLFGKDIFNFSDGNSILWVAYLFLVGYFIRRFKLLSRYRNKFLQLIISEVLLSVLVIVMTKVSMYLHQDVSTAGRFSKPWTFFSVYYSVSLFIFFETLNEKLNFFKARFKYISNYLVIVQVVINWPLFSYTISEKYKEAFPDSASEWAKRIFLLVIIYLTVSIIFLGLICLIQKIPFIRKIEHRLAVNSWMQLVDKLLKIKQWLSNRRRIIYIALFFYFFTALQMFLISDYQTKDAAIISLLRIFTQRQAPLFLNVIIIMAFLMLIFLITKRFWYAFSFTLMINLLLTISTVLKVKLRTDPILPSDLVFISNINEILSMISPVIIVVAIIVLIVLAVSTWIIQRKLNKVYKLKINNRRRLIYVTILVISFSGVFFINHQNSPSNLLFKLFIDDRHFFNQKNGAMRNGPIVQFIMNVDVKIMTEPSGYTKQSIQKIMKKYNDKADKINMNRNNWAENQTVIFTLSESFSDPSRLPNIELKQDPIPFTKKLSSQTTSGLMLSSGYGGGTANMEWQSLTGMDMSNLDATLPIPYTQLVNKQSISPSFLNLFDQSIAIHPYMGTLYNRLNVFKKFGFKKFHYLESPDGFKHLDKIDKNPYVSDASAYNETLDVIRNNQNETQFIQLSTMQNHMPYDDYYESNNFEFEGTGITDANKSAMNTYLKGINYSDEALKTFISELDKIQKPITLVWYGDHLPGIYKDEDLEKYPLLFRETDYFIYNNKFIQEQKKDNHYGLVSPYSFSALALEQANLKITPFYALLTEVAQNLPATTNDPNSSSQNTYNGQKIFVGEQNNMLKERNLSKNQKKLLKEYMLIQYDLVAGEQYSAKWASEGLSK